MIGWTGNRWVAVLSLAAAVVVWVAAGLLLISMRSADAATWRPVDANGKPCLVGQVGSVTGPPRASHDRRETCG